MDTAGDKNMRTDLSFYTLNGIQQLFIESYILDNTLYSGEPNKDANYSSQPKE